MSNALQVKSDLKALIDGLPDLASAQRTWGIPKRFDKVWITVGRIQWQSSEWATNRSREEQFTVEVLVSVVQSAGSAESVEREAHRLGTLIEAAVKANPGFSNPRVVTSGFAPQRLVSFPNDTEGFEAQYECAVSVTARL